MFEGKGRLKIQMERCLRARDFLKISANKGKHNGKERKEWKEIPNYSGHNHTCLEFEYVQARQCKQERLHLSG